MKSPIVACMLATVIICQTDAADQSPADDSWRRGHAALDRKAWGVAAVHFHEYRTAHPADPAGWVMEAWSTAKAGDDETAIMLYNSVLDLDPSQPDALYYLANRAWRDRDLAAAAAWIEKLNSVPSYLERDVHHLKGVLLAMQGGDPREAVSHLRIAGSDDPATRVLLGLSLLRLREKAEAAAVLEVVCPSTGRGLLAAWLTCLDVDYCGELLDDRLEILRLAFADESVAMQRESIWDVVRIHLRHRRCPESFEEEILEEARRTPHSCSSWLLKGLVEEACGAPPPMEKVCASFKAARECALSSGILVSLQLSGPLVDPRSGASLDLSSLVSTSDDLLASRCKLSE